MENTLTAHTTNTPTLYSRVDSDLKIEGSRLNAGHPKPGWRLKVYSRIAGTKREYWVHDGHIHHIVCGIYPPAANQTQFIIGAQVKWIEPSLREAIFKAIEEWSSAAPAWHVK